MSPGGMPRPPDRGPPAESYDGFPDDLRRCCARVLEAAANLADPAGEADLLFVGRSPESLFDLLRGLCIGTTWFGRLHLLHFSMRDVPERHLRRQFPLGLLSLRALLRLPRPGPRLAGGPPTPGRVRRPRLQRRDLRQPRPPARRTCFEHGALARRPTERPLVGLTRAASPAKRPGQGWQRHGPALDCLEQGAARRPCAGPAVGLPRQQAAEGGRVLPAFEVGRGARRPPVPKCRPRPRPAPGAATVRGREAAGRAAAFISEMAGPAGCDSRAAGRWRRRCVGEDDQEDDQLSGPSGRPTGYRPHGVPDLTGSPPSRAKGEVCENGAVPTSPSGAALPGSVP